MRICQLKFIAEKLLKGKGDIKPIRKNWPRAFLDRYPKLKSVFTSL